MSEIKILKAKDTMSTLIMTDVINVVEKAYSSQSKGNTKIYPLITDEFIPGKAEMDIKSGWMKNEKIYGMKVISWMADNHKLGLPSLLGTIIIFDSQTGVPLGILDGSYATCMRTGAAGAIGAKFLARADSKKLLIVGAGLIAKFQIAATLMCFPEIDKVMIYDGIDYNNSEVFVSKIEKILIEEFDMKNIKAKFEAVSDIASATNQSDIIITITPSREPIIKKEWVKPGTHLSCIGSDMQGKEEIDPRIFKNARIFVDDIEQCINVGEVEIPIKKGIIKPDNIIGLIGDVINQKVVGRENYNQITIYDATGTAVIDLLTGMLALEKATEEGLGQVFEL